MVTAAPEPINILRPGTFVDIHGTRVTVTRADLVDMAEAYDPADPAPFVFGHPKHDDPAMGWVGGLRMAGDTLQAVPGDVTPELSEAVGAKRYRKVSASYYPPTHPANPKPGRFSLKHVGLLGAMAPAIKGLGLIPAFAADDETAITIPEQEPAVTDTPEAIALAERETAIADREAAATTREAGLIEREATLIAAEQLRTRDEHVAFAEGLIDEAKLAPAGKDLVVGLLGALQPLAVVSFGELGDELAPVDAFRKLFDNAQPVVALGEAAPADKTITDEGEPSPEQLAAWGVAFMESEQAAGRSITIQAAIRHAHRNPPA